MSCAIRVSAILSQQRGNEETMNSQVLASVNASAPRCLLAIATMGSLGGLLVYLAMATAGASLPWRAVLAMVGAGALWLAWLMIRAPKQLDLTGTGLRDSTGTLVARLEDIRTLERGAFAMKPTGGFLLGLRGPAPWHWQPGIWWRVGRYAGIGGMMSAPQARHMAQEIEALLARRQRAEEQTGPPKA